MFDKHGGVVQNKGMINLHKGKMLLTGVAAASGIASVRIRNIGSNLPELVARILPGEFIIASPPLGRIPSGIMKTAAAVVIEDGSKNCGVSIIFRELCE